MMIISERDRSMIFLDVKSVRSHTPKQDLSKWSYSPLVWKIVKLLPKMLVLARVFPKKDLLYILGTSFVVIVAFKER